MIAGRGGSLCKEKGRLRRAERPARQPAAGLISLRPLANFAGSTVATADFRRGAEGLERQERIAQERPRRAAASPIASVRSMMVPVAWLKPDVRVGPPARPGRADWRGMSLGMSASSSRRSK